MTENVLFLYENQVDSATMTASSTAGSLGPDNLKNREIEKVARTTGDTAEWWKADFTEDVPISTVCLWNHNLSAGGTIRVRLSKNSDLSSPLFDQTYEAWPVLYGPDDIGLDMCGYGGYAILSEFQNYRYFWVARLGATYLAPYLGVDVAGAANPDGYIQAGRLIAGIGWQPSKNFSYGWSVDWQDESEQIAMDGGGLWIDERKKFRVLTLPFDFATEADANGSYTDFQRIVGHAKDVLVVPFPDQSGVAQYRSTLYGVPIKKGLGKPVQKGKNVFGFTVKFREIIA